jgi:hypothetical protein
MGVGSNGLLPHLTVVIIKHFYDLGFFTPKKFPNPTTLSKYKPLIKPFMKMNLSQE